MTRYKVIVTDRATGEIVNCAEYIASRSGSWRVAEEWVQRVYDAIESLDFMPGRYALAAESPRLGKQVRRILIGKYIANYIIDDSEAVVRVVGFRHGARRP